MGLADYLFAKKTRYGSERAVLETERLMKFIRNTAYEASVKIAGEKGSFPKYETVPYGKASFIRKLPAQLRMDIKKNGVRNCTLMAMAPTGTISLIPECSSGIEPLLGKAYRRADRISERIYIHPRYVELLRSGDEIPDWFVDSYDLQPKDHLEMQAIVQKYTDCAVSKTINLPNDTTAEQLSDLLLEYIHDVKGVTVYRDGCRPGQVLTKMSEEDARDVVMGSDFEKDQFEEAMQCASGKCTL
jgi:ribonucleoside-diphosphate reductase alpha chain